MKSIKIKIGRGLSLAHPLAKIGKYGSVFIVEVFNIPDEVDASRVLLRLNNIPVLAPRKIDFSELPE